MISAGSRWIFLAISATFIPSVYSNTSGNSRNLRGGTAGLFDVCCLPFFPFLLKRLRLLLLNFPRLLFVFLFWL